jgi:hypothetical protein
MYNNAACIIIRDQINVMNALTSSSKAVWKSDSVSIWIAVCADSFGIGDA